MYIFIFNMTTVDVIQYKCTGNPSNLDILGAYESVLYAFCVCGYLDTNQSDEFLKLEDITHRFKRPCIMDVKVYTRVSFRGGGGGIRPPLPESRPPLGIRLPQKI